MSAPRTSSCEPWITGDQLAREVWIKQAISEAQAAGFLTEEDTSRILSSAAYAATETLWRLSGRQFTGKCGPVTIRPTARPVDADSRGWVSRAWTYAGAGSFAMMTGGEPPVTSLYGEQYPSIIEINTFPVREILQVKIDGEVIPTDEYELREFKQLVRVRPTANYTPTARWGWPTSQLTDLPDDQPGTFSITYTYGADPGEMGRTACLELAKALALPQLGDSTHYPERVTNIVREGVSVQVASVIDVIRSKGSGIYEVDLFILTTNPNGSRRRAVVYSPDRTPNRRAAKPSSTS